MLLVLLSPPGAAWAQDADDFAPPPPPREQPPVLAGEVHLDMVFALAEGPICPDGAACIFNGGGGIAGILERRYPNGFALGIGYDAWFLDGNGVYELSVMQVVKAVLRYQMLRDRFAHPFVAAGFGGLLFGDSFRVATLGAALDLTGGLEVEITENLAGTVGLMWRLFTNGSFVSETDRVPRSDHFGVGTAVTLQVGLVILEERRRPR